MQQQKICVLTCLCIRTSKRYYRREKSDQTTEPSHTKQYTECNSDNRKWSRGASTHIPDTLTAIRYQDEILRPIVKCFAGAGVPRFLLVHINGTSVDVPSFCS
ncbi:hypothetical protein GOODEAATRI_026848 [Goodea atripinnis]|uniref:Uncharacterized protein n=1 Tax=Goodea atripinnis TaxID=208336 RepID=A0ABV0NNJ1_9TELE